MSEIVSTIIGVFVGFALSEFKACWMRKRKLKSHWATLRSDLEVCRQKSEIYLRDNIMAPLYRLPTIAYDHSIPELLIEGELTIDDFAKLTQFFHHAIDFNRGLDLVSSILGTTANEQDPLLKSYYERNCAYAQKMILGQQNEYYSAAYEVICRYIHI